MRLYAGRDKYHFHIGQLTYSNFQFQAGIPREQLKLGLEPELASIFCQNIPSNMVSEKLPFLKSGVKYAVADLGGRLCLYFLEV